MGLFGKHKSKVAAVLASATLVVGALTLGACGGGSDAYDEYASAYQQVSAKGGIDANIKADITMDGKTNDYSGNFKVDNTNNIIYYEMSDGDQTTTQFSDGTYLYTQRGNDKTKYNLSGSKPEAAPVQDKQGQGQKPDAAPADSAPEQKAPEFNTTDFVNEFASFLDAGKVKELGLLEPIDKAAVSKTTKEGDVYNLEVSDSIVKKFLNTMATQQSGSDAVQVTDLQNFKYTATVKNGVVTGTTYSGDITVKVPASLMSDKKDAEYTLNFAIDTEFQNPGEAVSVSLPTDTAEYKEVGNL